MQDLLITCLNITLKSAPSRPYGNDPHRVEGKPLIAAVENHLGGDYCQTGKLPWRSTIKNGMDNVVAAVMENTVNNSQKPAA
jgi:hypothetical protein